LPAPKRGRRVRKHPSSSFCTSHRIRTPHMAHSRHRAGLRRMCIRFVTPVGANMGSDSRLSLCYIPNINAGRAFECASPCKKSCCLRGRSVNRPYEYEYGICDTA